MNIAPLNNSPYDDHFRKVISIAQQSTESDDDCLLICAGDTGSGKTRLLLHAYELYAGTEADSNQIALSRHRFARALKNTYQLRKKFLGYDEANITSREAITRWNRELIDIYMNIRGLNIFHWWNNPSLQLLDKPFIEERVKGIFFITTKHRDKPRSYYFFTQAGFLRMLETHGNVKHNTIRRYGRRYATYMGWFRDYKGPLLSIYQQQKIDHMKEKVSRFVLEFGGEETRTVNHLSVEIGHSHTTVKKAIDYLINNKEFLENEHYHRTPSGRLRIHPEAKDLLQETLHSKRYKNLVNGENPEAKNA